ncbi:MAG TPA: M23 family metallopeptidase, partial [bacterium]|nr:M23 family metallopeptidase [bacterium]
RLTSRYGWRTRPMGPTERKHFHTGVDIAAPHGRTISAAESGQVLSACYAGALGNSVLISHRSGYSTLYGHAAKMLVRPGQYVKKGETIALVGSTGRSTGPHVHFEVLKNGKHIDPMQVLH